MPFHFLSIFSSSNLPTNRQQYSGFQLRNDVYSPLKHTEHNNIGTAQMSKSQSQHFIRNRTASI